MAGRAGARRSSRDRPRSPRRITSRGAGPRFVGTMRRSGFLPSFSGHFVASFPGTVAALLFGGLITGCAIRIMLGAQRVRRWRFDGDDTIRWAACT